MSDLEEHMIDLTIEALTGTVYDLCVSPFETILGIKMKIQRLEGIPVYQQQLVHGSVELQDEYCLEEYGIGSGAQLKLLVAMRGGPIHAHRVHLEDPALLEIAELLEGGEFDHRYTVMLLRDGDTLEVADVVQVVAEDSPEHISSRPQSKSSERQASVAAPSRMVQLEHAMTRDKMRDLITKLRKLRSYRKHQTQATVGPRHTGSQLHRRGMAKVLILDSHSPSQLLRSSAPSPLTPPLRRDLKTPTKAQRKLVFPCNDLNAVQTRSTEPHGSWENYQPSHQQLSALGKELPGCSSKVSHGTSTPHSSHPYQHKQWRRRRRLRRASCLEDKTPPHQQDVGELSEQMSQLALREKDSGRCGVGVASKDCHTLPHIPSPLRQPGAAQPAPRHNSSSPHLPPISVGHTHSRGDGGWGRGQRKGRSHCLRCGKKTGLASTYTCRCGGVFCSLHRYAEAHECSFDYKSQGREMIARGNPLVMAPKLPKI